MKMQALTANLLLLLPLLLLSSAAASNRLRQQQQQQQQKQQHLALLYPIVISTLLQHRQELQQMLRAEIPKWQNHHHLRHHHHHDFDNDDPPISQQCSQAYAVFLQGLLGLVSDGPAPNADQILRVLDSVGKPESGLLAGNFKWLGSRYVCETMQLPVFNTTNPSQFLFNSSGRYCIYSVASGNEASAATAAPAAAPFGGAIDQIGSQLSANLEWAICTPAVCNATESQIVNDNTIKLLFGLLAPILQNVPIIGDLVKSLASLELVVNRCAQTSVEMAQANFSTGAIVMICLSAVIISMVLISTVIVAVAKQKEMDIDDSKLLQLFKSFCLQTNLTKLFAQPSKESVHCLNGIRVLSIFWVILGHTLLLLFGFIKNPLILIDDVRKRWQSVIIINATMSVDTFFMLSGCLVAFVFFRRVGSDWNTAVRQISALKFWLLFYFHRYWRLTPPLMFFVMWYVNLLPYFGDSWIYPTNRKVYDIELCEEYWWTLLLYLQNFIKPNQSCIGHSWYLANDMQMFLISPILLLALLYGGLRGGSVATGGVVTISMLATALINFAYGFKSGSLPDTERDGYYPGVTYYEVVYVKPYCRIGAYAIGILLGYIFATRRAVKMHWSVAIILWLVAVACGLALLYLVQPQIAGTGGSITVAMGTVYWTLLRPGFALCVAWVAFACYYGYGGPVNALLSWSWWSPLAKLTYCTYIVHMVVQYMLFANLDQTLNYSDSLFIVLYLSTLMASFLSSLCLSMLVEAPLLGLEKLLFSGSTRARTSKSAVADNVENAVDDATQWRQEVESKL